MDKRVVGIAKPEPRICKLFGNTPPLINSHWIKCINCGRETGRLFNSSPAPKCWNCLDLRDRHDHTHPSF